MVSVVGSTTASIGVEAAATVGGVDCVATFEKIELQKLPEYIVQNNILNGPKNMEKI